MGMDVLDISYRIEKRFGVRLEPPDLVDACEANSYDLTAGMLHEIVCEKCQREGLEIPTSSWTRIRLILAETLAKPVREIKRDAWLCRNLGCE